MLQAINNSKQPLPQNNELHLSIAEQYVNKVTPVPREEFLVFKMSTTQEDGPEDSGLSFRMNPN